MIRACLLGVLLTLLTSCDLNVGGTQSGDDTETTTTIITETEGTQESPGFGQNPRCSGVQSLDGPGGFLWKAESETDGNLVILFPAEYVAPFLRVFVYGAESGEAEAGAFAGHTNDGRQTYRFDAPGEEYDGRVLVDAGDQECEWFVPDPANRQD